MGSTRFRKASLRSSSAPMRRSVSIRRLRSVSLSSPTRAPISAKVGSLRSSAPLGRILAEAALGNEADATPLRARKSEMVRMAPPQPDKTSRLIQTFPIGHNRNTDAADKSNHVQRDQGPMSRKPAAKAGREQTKACSAARQHVRPFAADAGLELTARARHGRETVAPRPGFAGIDNDARVARIIAAIRHWIQRRAPAAAQGFPVFGRGGAG